MGKNKKKSNYKIYPINSVEDGLLVLGQLIMSVKYHLEKYFSYNLELNNVIHQHIKVDLKSKEILESTPIAENVFHDLNDKILYRQMMILKMLADEQKASFSYKNVRRIFQRQNYLKNPLSEKSNQILNNFLDIRNWSFHNSQSMLSATKEVVEKTIPDELKPFVSSKHQLNPVYICVDDFYDISYLLSLDIHMKRRIEQFNNILECMISDYNEMYRSTNPQGFTIFNGELLDTKNVQFKIYRNKRPRKLFSQPDMVTQVSMAIQKSEYDGTKEVFDKWTCSQPKNNAIIDE